MRDVTYRGLTLADPYRPHRVQGLDSVSVRTGGDRDQPRGDGQLPGSHFQDARRITLDVHVIGKRADVLPDLLAAFQPSRSREHALTWRDEVDGELRRVWARVVDAPVTRDAALGPHLTEVRIGLKATDPRIYGAQVLEALRPYAVTGGGLNYPGDWPKDFSADTTVETIAHNAGDSDAHPTVRVRGPSSGSVERFRIENVTNGSELDVETSIGAGQTLTVRMREWVTGHLDELVVELDGATRYGSWLSRPDEFWLSPGDNRLRLIVESGDDPSEADLVWRHTYAGTRKE